MKITALYLLPLLLLTACASQETTESKASFDSPLFAKPPELLYKDHQYFAVLYPKENWSVVVSEVKVDLQPNATFVYATKLKQAHAASPQLFPLPLPPVDPKLLEDGLFWRNPNGWNKPMTVKVAP